MKGLPAKKGWAYGGVIFNQRGQVLLREPRGHFDRYVWTFPKGKAEEGESEEETALREVKEETGIIARIVKRIPGEFKGGTGSTIFFLMTVEEDTGTFEESKSIAWVDRAEAEKRIRQTTNPIGQERDLKVLEAAYREASPTPLLKPEDVLRVSGGVVCRLFQALNAFKARYETFPTKLLISADTLRVLREEIFTERGMKLLEAKIRIRTSRKEQIVVEDESGNRFDYGKEGWDVDTDGMAHRAEEWLGFERLY